MNACMRCHMLVARYAPQVLSGASTYHRECYEAWYFGRYGRRPRLEPTSLSLTTFVLSAEGGATAGSES